MWQFSFSVKIGSLWFRFKDIVQLIIFGTYTKLIVLINCTNTISTVTVVARLNWLIQYWSKYLNLILIEFYIRLNWFLFFPGLFIDSLRINITFYHLNTFLVHHHFNWLFYHHQCDYIFIFYWVSIDFCSICNIILCCHPCFFLSSRRWRRKKNSKSKR